MYSETPFRQRTAGWRFFVSGKTVERVYGPWIVYVDFLGYNKLRGDNMDTERKKQLMMEYKNRRPEMGVISLKCKATGEAFLGTSEDTRTAFNSISARLSGLSHPNKRLQELWNKYGAEGFEQKVIRVLNTRIPVRIIQQNWKNCEQNA